MGIRKVIKLDIAHILNVFTLIFFNLFRIAIATLDFIYIIAIFSSDI